MTAVLIVSVLKKDREGVQRRLATLNTPSAEFIIGIDVLSL